MPYLNILYAQSNAILDALRSGLKKLVRDLKEASSIVYVIRKHFILFNLTEPTRVESRLNQLGLVQEISLNSSINNVDLDVNNARSCTSDGDIPVSISDIENNADLHCEVESFESAGSGSESSNSDYSYRYSSIDSDENSSNASSDSDEIAYDISQRETVSRGDYYHFGLKNAILKIASEIIKCGNNKSDLRLLINTDGAPTGKSSEKTLWPILCSEISQQTVRPIGIFYGDHKPTDANEFLKPFVDEAVEINKKEIECKGKLFNVQIDELVCDTPAKAMVLNISYPTGYNSCTKCDIEGTYTDRGNCSMFRLMGLFAILLRKQDISYPTGYNSCTKCDIEGTYTDRVCFPNEPTASLRSDDKFRNFEYYPEYQHKETILNKIPSFGLVTNSEDYLNYAENLLKYFVKTFEKIYGTNYIAHNVHNVLHLVDDVRRFGHLDRFSAFRFENSIFKLKTMIRKYDKPLQQIAKRVSEHENGTIENTNIAINNSSIQTFKKPHNGGPVTTRQCTDQYRVLFYNNYCIKVSSKKDDCVLINGDYVKVYNFVRYNNIMYVIGKQLQPVDDVYNKPCKSSNLKSHVVKLDDKLKMWKCAKIEAKLMFYRNANN
ncbi:hypothetical protein TSAR_005508 [Trichomalopsis sarcophagae]|uniref:DUF4806 domain-containing protein n=1 Tax=Trichomalopsis sarcophagae TaxID=543379 RepID=A0A232EF54_9HYME|nr:hypothetical protein TSAR_005508 [Trichomalopsis sarcophagae]